MHSGGISVCSSVTVPFCSVQIVQKSVAIYTKLFEHVSDKLQVIRSKHIIRSQVLELRY